MMEEIIEMRDEAMQVCLSEMPEWMSPESGIEAFLKELSRVSEQKLTELVSSPSFSFTSLKMLLLPIELNFGPMRPDKTSIDGLMMTDASRTARFLLQFALGKKKYLSDDPMPLDPVLFDRCLAMAHVLQHARTELTLHNYAGNFRFVSDIRTVNGEIRYYPLMSDITNRQFLMADVPWKDEFSYTHLAFSEAFTQELGMSPSRYENVINALFGTKARRPFHIVSELGLRRSASRAKVTPNEVRRLVEYHTFDPAANIPHHLAGRLGGIFYKPFIRLGDKDTRWLFAEGAARAGLKSFLAATRDGVLNREEYASPKMKVYVEKLRSQRDINFEISLRDVLRSALGNGEHDYSLNRFNPGKELGRVDAFGYCEASHTIYLIEAKYINAIQFQAADTADLVDKFFYKQKNGRDLSYRGKWTARHEFVIANLDRVLAYLNVDTTSPWQVKTIVVTSRNCAINQIEDRVGPGYEIMSAHDFEEYLLADHRVKSRPSAFPFKGR